MFQRHGEVGRQGLGLDHHPLHTQSKPKDTLVHFSSTIRTPHDIYNAYDCSWIDPMEISNMDDSNVSICGIKKHMNKINDSLKFMVNDVDKKKIEMLLNHHSIIHKEMEEVNSILDASSITHWKDASRCKLASFFVSVRDEARYQPGDSVGTIGNDHVYHGVLNIDCDFQVRQNISLPIPCWINTPPHNLT